MHKLDNIIVKMNSIAEAGFPDVMCPVIFLGGCNFKCPYCLNADLVTNPRDRKFIPLSEIEKYVKDNGEEHILISGGEPCLNPDLGDLIDALKKMGLKVRLSSNGSRAEVLHDMIFDHGVSFVALDVKTDLTSSQNWGHFMSEDDRDDAVASVYFLNILLDQDVVKHMDGFTFEFRTTLYPPLVGWDQIESISKTIHPDSVWYLQQFRPREGLLSPEASSVKPYTTEELDELVKLAQKRVKKTYVRWP